MQRLEASGAVRPLEWSLGIKGLTPATSNILHFSGNLRAVSPMM